MPVDNAGDVGARLRALREAPPYWSRTDLARLIRDAADPAERDLLPHVPSLATSIKQWETGKHLPGHRYRRLLSRVFDSPERELFHVAAAPFAVSVELTPDDEDRLGSALTRPARLDGVVVESLATILVQQRRLDDTLGPAAVLPSTRAQADSVVNLYRQTRGTGRDLLAPVAAEWVQFHGWLLAEHRVDHAAAHLLTDAETIADEAGHGVLAAQAANFKGYLARQQGNPRGIVRHFLTAYHTPGASPAQRLGDAVQAAQGFALLGDAAAARRLLAEADALENVAARTLPPDTAYWLTPDFHHINIGLALGALGEHAAAAEHIQAGLESLPPDQQGAEWTREYRDALRRELEQA
ncbi:hypothetical protein [Actinomadura atramentaria]|uniref:hypothetical protein n=1 Tax=Actinomadura atramentaria TaxID=1990 RepID=UPI00036073FC|nr:hypothetical protein [Actinomadura atramentaria]